MAPNTSRKRTAAHAPSNPPSKRVKPTHQTKPASSIRMRPSTKTPFRNIAPTNKLEYYVCGEGSAGELGLGPKNARDVELPRINPNLNSVVNIAPGGMHAVALTSENKVLTWGVNDQGTLGRDTTWEGGLRDVDAEDPDSDDDDDALNPRESTPTNIDAPTLAKDKNFVQVAASDSATFALTEDGLVYGCGTFRDMNGVFGFFLDSQTAKVVEVQSRFTLIPGLKQIRSISVGADFALALDNSGRVFGWGNGQQSQLGRRLIERRRYTALQPTPIPFPRSFKATSIHAGVNHSFAIDLSGDTWAWGSNNFAQTGVPNGAGEEGNQIGAPRRVPSLAGKKMKMLQGGSFHSLAVTEKGECLVWGRMDGGQVGLDVGTLPINDPSTVVSDDRGNPRILLRPTPLPIPKCVYVAAGTEHSIAITEEGEAYSWGFNINYQCGQGTEEDIWVAKRMDEEHIRDKTVVWAGAGGQYSMLGARAENPTANDSMAQHDTEATSTSNRAGAAVYTHSLLRYFYDLWVLKISNTYIWRCPTQGKLLPLFRRHLSPRHLDIGVGSGFYLASSHLSEGSHVTLADLNPNSLEIAAAAVRRASPSAEVRTVQQDVLADDFADADSPLLRRPSDTGDRNADGGVDPLAGGERFESISMFFLLHCLPGPPKRKGVALAKTARLLEPERGVLNGATILGSGVEHNLLGRILMYLYNQLGIFSNDDDGVDNIIDPLRNAFNDVEWKVEGVVLMFTAWNPKR
ncbi:MAG: hypothetical protein M1831_007175 [Alyxoria varia]|nr:MAG: hypothetical protein M1831_007175 [Alyxoria varia]